MAYLFIALAVFWILRFVQVWIEIKEPWTWLWQVIALGTSTLALAPWDQSWIHWYSPFAIAGIVALFQLTENFLITSADRAMLEALKSVARRSR